MCEWPFGRRTVDKFPAPGVEVEGGKGEIMVLLAFFRDLDSILLKNLAFREARTNKYAEMRIVLCQKPERS